MYLYRRKTVPSVHSQGDHKSNKSTIENRDTVGGIKDANIQTMTMLSTGQRVSKTSTFNINSLQLLTLWPQCSWKNTKPKDGRGKITFSRSSGWVQHAAPALPSPPKYHRAIFFVFGLDSWVLSTLTFAMIVKWCPTAAHRNHTYYS